jgi:hypothetical protein
VFRAAPAVRIRKARAELKCRENEDIGALDRKATLQGSAGGTAKHRALAVFPGAR